MIHSFNSKVNTLYFSEAFVYDRNKRGTFCSSLFMKIQMDEFGFVKYFYFYCWDGVTVIWCTFYALGIHFHSSNFLLYFHRVFTSFKLQVHKCMWRFAKFRTERKKYGELLTVKYLLHFCINQLTNPFLPLA